MARNKKAYKEENLRWLADVAQHKDVNLLPGGVLYKVLQSGSGDHPTVSNVIQVYYRGMTIDGKVFDDNTSQAYPEAFRLHELIEGWQIAIQRMRVGDRWEIYIPADKAYGSRGEPGIPPFSTLIFEITLAGMA